MADDSRKSIRFVRLISAERYGLQSQFVQSDEKKLDGEYADRTGEIGIDQNMEEIQTVQKYHLLGACETITGAGGLAEMRLGEMQIESTKHEVCKDEQELDHTKTRSGLEKVRGEAIDANYFRKWIGPETSASEANSTAIPSDPVQSQSDY